MYRHQRVLVDRAAREFTLLLGAVARDAADAEVDVDVRVEDRARPVGGRRILREVGMTAREHPGIGGLAARGDDLHEAVAS